MKIYPIGPRILIEKYFLPVKKEGVLISLDSDVDHHFGKVILLCLECESAFIPGMIVKYLPYSAKVIDPKQPNMLVIDEKDVIAVVEL